jgi:hypothetical protein
MIKKVSNLIFDISTRYLSSDSSWRIVHITLLPTYSQSGVFDLGEMMSVTLRDRLITLLSILLFHLICIAAHEVPRLHV